MNLYNISGIIFYVLFFSFIFSIIRNKIYIVKNNLKEEYEEINKNNKESKISKRLFIVNIVLSVILGIYILIAIILVIFILVLFITLLIIVLADSQFLNNLWNFTKDYFSLFKYVLYIMYINIYIVFIRFIYINLLNYKEMKNPHE